MIARPARGGTTRQALVRPDMEKQERTWSTEGLDTGASEVGDRRRPIRTPQSANPQFVDLCPFGPPRTGMFPFHKLSGAAPQPQPSHSSPGGGRQLRLALRGDRLHCSWPCRQLTGRAHGDPRDPGDQDGGECLSLIHI
eukprot:11456557-Alexandrium_andersonii.AAC.1